ncbi:hypothetical protein HMPREF9306_01196 [Propionimicrobium lymphophilum ACS-093-V-SCH5]|uniref:AAA+ ATPase domain-containing protein n=1 Tax=Propionimicrobium lymphophilum ACS-093-V-SCH5 TaxID=883161 RepID=S2VZC6_9ACTN|nr:ATP-binding protein [Propionimicrobium lymphophilum]EPD32888.1 hypothetical protein HMPREF9306_01196 [Propionimicrobium lymphophilum ACS-093-V-SCH5]
MAKPQIVEDFKAGYAQVPLWPTTLRKILPGGILVGADPSSSTRVPSVWMYRRVPLSPMIDAPDLAGVYSSAATLEMAFSQLAALASPKMNRRQASKGSYREFHCLLINVPRLFLPGREHALSDWMMRAWPDQIVDHRICLFGVRLGADMGTDRGWRGAIEAVAETFSSEGVPLSAYMRDADIVGKTLDRAGLQVASESEIRFGDAWWNHGRYADTPFVPHSGHLHVFNDMEAGSAAVRAGLVDCKNWPKIPGQGALTMATVSSLDYDMVDVADARCRWACDLLDNGALAISLRGRVEPGDKVTRHEIRRQRNVYRRDINERAAAGKMSRPEQEEKFFQLEQLESVYSAEGSPPATLTDFSALVAFDGIKADMARASANMYAPVGLNVMAHRQFPALSEMMLCSPARANPNLKDVPATVVSYSGISDLSTVGDKDGALLGFTERGSQPAYLSPTAASGTDSAPLLLVVGATGSGKTFLLQNLAFQFAKMPNRRGEGTPVVFINPKSQPLYIPGATSHSLDDLIGVDGVFDPIRFSTEPANGISLASSLLLTINPWGTKRTDMEAPLLAALTHGVSRGATCTGQALEIAERELADLPPDMVKSVFSVIDAVPMARALVGRNPAGESLRVASGITLIQAGTTPIDLPEGTKEDSAPLAQRVALALLRQIVYASQSALAGRDGVVFFDEAWIFTSSSPRELDQLGRLARSLQVMPIMATQRATDAVSTNLTNYISRFLILAVGDPVEARAAMAAAGWDGGDDKLARITASATIGATSDGNPAPNWGSLRALHEVGPGGKRKLVRGSVCFYKDLDGRVVPVEINVPPALAKQFSTNPDDIARREAENKSTT